MSQIYEVMPALVADVQAVGKNHENLHHRYKYRAVDDLMAALHPLLGKHGVSVVPRYDNIQILDTGKGVRVVLRLDLDWVAKDGSKLTTTTFGEGTDSGDKATYKSMAGALKYAILQTLCVPTEETRGKQDPESDSGTDEPAPAPKRTVKKKSDAAPPAVKKTQTVDDITALIEACTTEDELQGIRQEVRAWVERNPEQKKQLVDAYVAKQESLKA